MAYGSRIKWRDKDNENLRKTIAEVNKKVRAEIKANPQMEHYMPKRQTVKELKSKIGTRAEYNRELKAMKRFVENDSARLPLSMGEGITTTKWELDEVKRRVRLINKRNKKLREEADLSPSRMVTHLINDMGISEVQLKLEKKNAEDWKHFVENIERRTSSKLTEKQQDKYKENYIKGLRNAYGKQATALIKKIKGMTSKQVYEMQYKSPILNIEFIYDPMEISRKIKGIFNAIDKE